MSKENHEHDFNVIYKSFTNILKNLHHQGYDIESQKDVSLTELQNRIETGNINFLVESKTKNKCYVIYHIMKQLRPSHIHEYIEDIYEFREILNKITNVSNIPTISKFDPISKAIGLKPGEICEITRQSKTVVESKYYRICI